MMFLSLYLTEVWRTKVETFEFTLTNEQVTEALKRYAQMYTLVRIPTDTEDETVSLTVLYDELDQMVGMSVEMTYVQVG
jgi:hypothetical protein